MTISAENLTYQVSDEIKLVSDVSLNLNSGKVTGVIGPNGAGKSTLLKLLCGELQPSSGDIKFSQKKLSELDPNFRATHVGVLPQSTYVNFDFVVFEIVRLGRLPHAQSSSSKIDQEITWKCLEMTDTARLASRRFNTLSGGEKQRVHLARVLAQLFHTSDDDLSDKVLLLDEPTTALDLSHQHRVLEIARDVAKRNASVLVILHDLNLAAQYADEINLLCCGEMMAKGSPSEVLTADKIRRVYGVEAIIQPHPDGDYPMIMTRTKQV